MKKPILQAHRGVSTDCPENTLSAIRAAGAQGYGIVELDPAVTCDGEIVLLHDGTVNRTARLAGGEALAAETKISDLSYAELLKFDFGLWFSPSFRGEKIPLLSEALAAAKAWNLAVKIDNKFQGFAPESIEKLFDIAEKSGADVGFTVNSLDFARLVCSRFPNATLHYDGEVTDEILQELSALVPKEKLAVWLPYPTELNTWVKVPFVSSELCEKVKKYAALGLWILSREEEYADAARRFAPDIIETTGGLKPR